MQRYLCVILVLLALCGCGRKQQPTLICYCTEAFYPAMVEHTRTFYAVYKIPIDVAVLRQPEHEIRTEVEPQEEQTSNPAAPPAWLNRPTDNKPIDLTQVIPARIVTAQLDIIESARIGDIFITDFPEEITMLHERGMVRAEYPVYELSLKFVVKEGRSDKIGSIQSLLDQRLPIGIMNPGRQGCGSVALSMLAHYRLPVEMDRFQEIVKIYDRQSELEEALRSDEVAGILLWDVMIDPEKKIGDVMNIPLDPPRGVNSEENQSDRVRNLSYHPTRSFNLMTLSFTEHDAYVVRFVDFLRSQRAASGAARQ